MKPEELSDRDWAIVRHIYRYRLSTTAIILQQFFPGCYESSARNVIRRLIAQGWIGKAVFAGQQKYLLLDKRGILACRSDPRQRVQFSDFTVPGFFAVLYYCIRTGHERLTQGDLRAIEPDFDHPSVWGAAHYVRQTDCGPSLGCFRIDSGLSPRRLVSRAETLVAKRYHLPKFRELIEAGHFNVTFLTAYPSMVEATRQEIAERHRGPTAFYVELVPELAALLAVKRQI